MFGGGAAGLWTLDRLRRAGYSALLLESRALGAGQTIQSQGIIHGGGKYALRGVGDIEAVRVIRDMPHRWRAHVRGEREPNLSQARLRSEQCFLWLPKGSLLARAQSFGFVPMLGKTGLLHTPPVPVRESEWPPALRGSAIDVYAMEEPVVETATLLEALAAPHREWISLYQPASGITLQADGAVRTASPEATLRARAIVLAAGSGNSDLLTCAGLDATAMQERPLRMALLRGRLPALFGHCILGGKTRITVTSAPLADGRVVWQVGGEIAEECARLDDGDPLIRKRTVEEVRLCLPGLDFAGIEFASHSAQRAEARTADLRRPSGVHASRVGERLWVAWPTKLALAPVLADELFDQLSVELGAPTRYDGDPFDGPKPPVAAYPWEQATWSPAL